MHWRIYAALGADELIDKRLGVWTLCPEQHTIPASICFELFGCLPNLAQHVQNVICCHLYAIYQHRDTHVRRQTG